MNKTYAAVFSYYLPEDSASCDLNIKIEADDRYEARVKAWQELEDHPDRYFYDQPAKMIRLCGINWEGNRLDMQDYFDSIAESCKTEMNRIKNVEIANEWKRKPPDAEQMDSKRRQLYIEADQLHLIDCIAKDLYQSHGIIPPSIHTELFYARRMADDLRYRKEYDLADKLEQRTWDAARWSSSDKAALQDLFRERYFYYSGTHYAMDRYFERGGCFPVHTDNDYIPRQEQQMGGI